MSDASDKTTDMSQPKTPAIENRMEYCGDGRHVGWWMEDCGLGNQSLLVEVEPSTVCICCCEGERAERRINFITDREKAVGIVRDMAKALGLEIANG